MVRPRRDSVSGIVADLGGRRMQDVDAFLDQFGLIAVCAVLAIRGAGVPIPVPGDVILLATAARAAQGKYVLWQAFAAVLLAVVVGGVAQFLLARGPGRGVVFPSRPVPRPDPPPASNRRPPRCGAAGR